MLHGNYSSAYGSGYSSFQFYEPHFTLISQNKEKGESLEGVHSVKRMTALFRLIQKAKDTSSPEAFSDFMDGFKSWLKHAKWENTATQKQANEALKKAQLWSEVANRRFEKTVALETELKEYTA